MGALLSLLGVRALVGTKSKLRVFLPEEIVEPVEQILATATTMQRYDLSANLVPMKPGTEVSLGSNLYVRSFRTFHPVPSLGYLFLRRVDKLRAEFHGLNGQEIRDRKEAGEDLFDKQEHLEVAYATDTLAKVLDNQPEIGRAKVLILECTFLDDRKSIEATHAGCHIHLDELIERRELLQNEHLVLMHFSQIYKPQEVPQILAKRCPGSLLRRIQPLIPRGARWPG
jgi:ribonuclease Z